MAREVDIVHGPLWRRMAAFVLPIMAGTLFQQLYYYVDAMVVGHVVGATALGAVDSTRPVLGLFVDFFVGLCTGATVVISQLWGAHDNRRLSTAVHTALAFAFVAGLAITVVCLPLAEPILRFMNTPPENIGHAAVIRVQLLASFMHGHNIASILRKAVATWPPASIFAALGRHIASGAALRRRSAGVSVRLQIRRLPSRGGVVLVGGARCKEALTPTAWWPSCASRA